MTEIAALGLRVDGVQNVDKASASLDKLSTSSDKAQKSTDGLAGTSKKSSRDVESLAESSKQAAGGVDGLATVAKRAAGIMVAAFGTIKLTSLIKDAALANSRFEQLGIVMERVGQNVNLSSDQVNRYAKEVEGMGISMTESRNTVIRMIQAQMDLSKASELARLAQDAAVIANTNSSDALGRLIYGLQSGQVEILRNMGLNVNFANSYTALAKEMDITVAELSEADKAQARMNAVMQAGVQIAGTYEASMDSASKQLGSTTRYVEDLGVMIGGLFSDAAKQAVFGYSDTLKELHGTVRELSEDGSLERWSRNVAAGVDYATDVAAALALVLGGRLVASLTASAGSMLFAAQQSLAYQAALARMAGVSATAAAGQYALAASVRAASGALALIGGPVGAAVIAAGALFYFREELGLVAPNSDRAEEAIGRLTQGMDRLTAAAARNRLSDLEDQLSRAEAAVNVLQGSFNHLSDDLQRRPDNWRVAKQLDKVTEELENQIKSVAKYQDAIRQMQGHLDRVSEGYMTKEEILSRLPRAIENTTTKIKGQSKEAENLEKRLQSLIDKYDKLGSKQRTAVAELASLQKASAMGLPGAEAAIDGFYESLMVADDALKRAQESVKELADEADPFAEIWKNTTQRVQGWFADAFYDILDKGKITFDGLLDMFKRMAAEMMAQRIMISIGGMMGGGNAFAGALGGGGGGAGLLGSVLNTGSWISAGKTLWQGFSGLATGQGLSGFSGILGRFGADAAFESAALKGGLEAAWAQADAAASMSKFANTVGPILAGIGGAIQGWQSGNRANAVTGAIGGWGGAKAGAAAGTYILPGIGTAIGAVIGGILGSSLGSSVFGGAWENRRSGIQLGFDEEGLNLEDWVRQTKKGGWFSSTRRRYIYSEMEEGLASEFQTGYDVMIDVLGTQFLAIGADLDRAVFEAVRIGSESINTSDQTEEQVQEQIEKWFNDLNAAMIQGALNAAGDTSAAVRLLRATGGDAAMLEALGGLMGVAGINAVQQARDAQTQLTMVESYRAVTDATRTLIGEYDGSLEATLGLTEAMAIQQEMAFGLATAYLQASDAVGALFGNLKESIRTSLMGAEELYEYQRGQVHSLTDLLGTLTDPEAIYRASQEIEQLVSGMWSRLDEDQRSTLGDEFLDYLDRTEALAQDRLAQGLAELESSQSDIYSALTSQMNDVADRMIETADRMQEAANLQWQSALQFGAYVSQMGGIMSGANQGMEQNA